MSNILGFAFIEGGGLFTKGHSWFNVGKSRLNVVYGGR